MHRLVVFGTAILAAAFIVAMGMQLPEVVASHFSAGGKPDASLSRAPFVALMSLLAAVLPPTVWWLQVWQASRGAPKIPSAAYWLSAERRASTLHWLSGHAAVFSVTTSLFLCWVFWLVVKANTSATSSLSLASFYGALLIYLLFTSAWVAALYLRLGGHVASNPTLNRTRYGMPPWPCGASVDLAPRGQGRTPSRAGWLQVRRHEPGVHRSRRTGRMLA
jgi:hypothetical protein